MHKCNSYYREKISLAEATYLEYKDYSRRVLAPAERHIGICYFLTTSSLSRLELHQHVWTPVRIPDWPDGRSGEQSVCLVQTSVCLMIRRACLLQAERNLMKL